MEGLKVHSKICLINRRKGRPIAIVGTGNFHEGNAAVYTDYFMMTSNKKITEDVAKVFDIIKKPYDQQNFGSLLVPPFNMREKFYELIDNEIAEARAGREAWIKIKINHVTDREMVERLYKASQAGVKIDMVVRGNCSLVTGVKGVSDNIRVAGIIDRYLEHSRIFIFNACGDKATYMGSADWMPRNLDRRIEVVTKVYDSRLKEDLERTVDYGLRDNVQARIVDGSGENRIRVDANGDRGVFRSQEQLYNAYKNNI